MRVRLSSRSSRLTSAKQPLELLDIAIDREAEVRIANDSGGGYPRRSAARGRYRSAARRRRSRRRDSDPMRRRWPHDRPCARYHARSSPGARRPQQHVRSPAGARARWRLFRLEWPTLRLLILARGARQQIGRTDTRRHGARPRRAPGRSPAQVPVPGAAHVGGSD